MTIKRIIQLSFTFIIGLILVISLINITTVNKIESNATFKDLISNLIRIQEKMNNIIIKSINTNNIKSLERYTKSFKKEEEKFKKLEKAFLAHDKKKFFDDLILDILKQNIVKENLDLLYKNKNNITKQYALFLKVKKSRLKSRNSLSRSKTREKNLKETTRKIFLSKADLALINSFVNIQYQGKEAIANYRNKKLLKNFLTTASELFEETDIKEVLTYQKAVKNLIYNSISYSKIRTNESRVIKKVKKLIISNDKINTTINNNIKSVHDTILRNNNIMLFAIATLTILSIIFLAIKVSRNVGLSVDEIHEKVLEGTKKIESLNHEIEETQKEVLFTMGTIGENRSKETGNHVKRVAEYSKLLALHYGLDENIAEMLKQASPMHDIGKVAIPDSVLNKPGKFDEHELKIMDTHAQLGYDMLKHSKRPLLKMAATVAYEHHERWDGTGYPNALKGVEIHIYGRITALADVFDALGSDRVYKKAWRDEAIFKLFEKEKGKHFDPKLVDIFFKHLDEFLAVRERFKDII